jgi:putative flippase GtrA
MRAAGHAHGDLSSFIRFCAVGAVGFAVDAGVLMALLALYPDALIGARLVSILVALTLTWALNRRHTFGSRDPKMFVEWSRFAGVNGLGAILNFAVYSALLYTFPGTPPLAALAAGSALALAFNYLGSRRFVFAGRSSRAA